MSSEAEAPEAAPLYSLGRRARHGCPGGGGGTRCALMRERARAAAVFSRRPGRVGNGKGRVARIGGLSGGQASWAKWRTGRKREDGGLYKEEADWARANSAQEEIGKELNFRFKEKDGNSKELK